ncbi:hypothetical protein HDK90DRAFT_464070 [Phyllosticta capitalensis]|uniref:Uncharacterized protein n=1 Tax=Phyllosticta capitalensis TaxID=121624 RepID=A0ABR1YW75_9PEZI
MESQEAPPASNDQDDAQRSEQLEVVDCRLKNPVLMPQSVYDKTPAPGGQRLRRFGRRLATKYAAPTMIDRSESPVDLEVHNTVPGAESESEFPEPFPPPRTFGRDGFGSFLNSRASGNGKLSMTSQHCEIFSANIPIATSDQNGLLGSSEDAFKSPTPHKAKGKGKGKCHKDELEEPSEDGTNIVPGMTPTPSSNDSLSNADPQKDSQAQILEYLNSRSTGEPEEKVDYEGLKHYIDGIRRMTSLLSMGVTISDFIDRRSNQGSSRGSSRGGGSEAGSRAQETVSEAETEIDEDGKAEQAEHAEGGDDGEQAAAAAAGGSQPKPAKKNRKSKGKKKGKKKW